MAGEEGSGKTHMLYTALVGQGGMQTVQTLQPTLGFNCELFEDGLTTLTVWDVGGSPDLSPSTLKSLYTRNINFAAIIFMVDVCKPILLAKQ